MLLEKWWKLAEIDRLMLVGFVCLFSLALTSKSRLDENSLLYLVLTSLSLHGPILIGAGIFLRGCGMSWNEAFGFSTPPMIRAVLFGVIAAIVFIPVGIVLQDVSIKILTWSHVSTPPQNAVEQFSKTASAANRAYLAFFAIVIAPFAEEILFRGGFYAALRKIGYPRTGLWASAFVFAAIHVSAAIFLPLFVFGLLLAWLYERTNNLLTCIIAHSVFNIFNVILIMFAPH